MQYHTGFTYSNRKDKAEYVWRKYKKLLKGRILDVGADKCYLKNYIPNGTEYVGIGFGEDVDVEINLEKEKIPFADNSFDCVLCMDVLEHLDNIHAVFDDCCRVTKKNFIVALPNPWGSFIGMLLSGYYNSNRPLKFYSLPTEVPEDRHKWFYGIHEAKRFFKERGRKNGMNVIQIDNEVVRLPFRRRLLRLFFKLVVNKEVDIDSLLLGRIWAVLTK